MNRSYLIEEFIKICNTENPENPITKKDATGYTDVFFKAITEVLKNHEKLAIVGFGSWTVKHRPKKEGRNPKTGEKMIIAASNGVSFKVGKNLKDYLNATPAAKTKKKK